MLNLTREEVGAALMVCAVVAGATVAGWMMHEGVSRETRAVVDVVPPVESAPLPRILHEEHLTGWEGMSGGATLDAKVVRTMGAAPPAGWVLQRPLQATSYPGTPWPLGK